MRKASLGLYRPVLLIPRWSRGVMDGEVAMVAVRRLLLNGRRRKGPSVKERVAGRGLAGEQ